MRWVQNSLIAWGHAKFGGHNKENYALEVQRSSFKGSGTHRELLKQKSSAVEIDCTIAFRALKRFRKTYGSLSLKMGKNHHFRVQTEAKWGHNGRFFQTYLNEEFVSIITFRTTNGRTFM